ncbi:GIY-YIG nuclease family protein [Pleurocapsa sp. PCC 7319]|uniref:GIY-YIG nuclease family protein n=1 Tax=Pleurocapsa sp. PCC 7319 TaxID=118161 RepID=UPI00034B015D|nr:GIY-YIG nuclease family protein [Pleurocapsa sp. PCC 7319]
MESENNTPIEHQNVPTAHQGLHSFLYSSDDEHNVDTSSVALESDGTAIVLVSEWQQQVENSRVAGVYAVLNSDRIYQYIGYSRDVLRSLKGHIAQNGEQVCAFIRVKTFKFPKRQAMEALQNKWIAELDYIPLGNTGEQGTWARTIGEAAKAAMSDAERNAYEEKKLKLRKAMADATLTDEMIAQGNNSEADLQRHQKLEAAVKNDDWSSVIDSQNK